MSEFKNDVNQVVSELTDEIELNAKDRIDRIRHNPDMEAIREFLGEVVIKAYTAGYQAAQQEQSEGDGKWTQ